MRILLRLRLHVNTVHTKIQLLNPRNSCIVTCNRNIFKHFQGSTEHTVNPYIKVYQNCNEQRIRNFSMSKVLAKEKAKGKDKKKQLPKQVDMTELAEVINAEKLIAQYENTLETLKENFVKYVSIRSTVGAIEQLPVKFEEDEYTLQELAQISRKPKLIVLDASAFPQTIPQILESINKSQMNLSPQQDGTKIFIPIPVVTKEHRESLAKSAKVHFNKCCESIREVRNRHVKMLKKEAESVSEDVLFRAEGSIDALMHQYMDKAKKMLEAKQNELLANQ